MKYKNNKKYKILGRSVIFSIIFFSIVFSINAASAGGGPDCKKCMDDGGYAPEHVNFSVANNSGHKSLNKEASSTVNAEDKKCWACHGDGTQPVSGHPANFKTPAPCENCHTGAGGYGAPLATGHIDKVKIARVACNICHGNTGMYTDNGIPFINAASASDKTYYWTPSSVAIGSSGYKANWGSCGVHPTSYKITSLSSSGFGCNIDYLTTTKSGDQFLAISPTNYSSNTTIAGKTDATFNLSSQKSGYTATYRFDLGYAQKGTFKSLGYKTQAVSSRYGQSYIIDLSSINFTAPAGSYLALKVSVTTSSGGRIYLGTNANSGRFNVTETVTAPSTPTYNVTIMASPISAVITQGGNYTYNITVNNTGNANGDYTLAVSDSDSTNFITPSVLGRTSIYVPARGSNKTTLKVTANSTAAGGAYNTPTVIAVSVQNSSYTNFTQVLTTVTSAGGLGGDNCLSCHAGAQ
ncbi:MAG: hypothetical protein O8C66_04430 [Candidatus Methanoperedens sp.]|nr:hypothetical protein [Candidatus Methanoperedens sp.]MCZ7369735.1 hypothetical protein [Candidatus Methanoperedens sp.]